MQNRSRLLWLFSLALLAPHAGAQSLDGLWRGQDTFMADTTSGPYGSSFGMHFLSSRWEGTQLWSYYIANTTVDGVGRSVTGLALSKDGVNFTDQGVVLDIGGAWQWSYSSKVDFQHAIGRADADGWSASTSLDASGYLCYGPYTTEIPSGPNTVLFELLIDNNSADDLVVARIDVYDVTSQTVLAWYDIRRSKFTSTHTYQTFFLNFTQVSGHKLEFRTYWHDLAYMRQRNVGVTQGDYPYFDDRLASFPGVWKDGATWYLVYEGAGTSSSHPGDIGLATSTDGIHWVKSDPNPILVHQSSGWEKVNIGTPSLWKEGSTWYLFYHGFDGTDVQIGVATGTDLKELTRYAGNPIVRTGATGTWDSGTAGKRSIWKEGATYYMAYEGSTEQPYDTAQWSSGLARSTDLLKWEKFWDNPILPQTAPGAGFGYDGPELIQTPDARLHLYYRANGPGNKTYRATLTAVNSDLDGDGISDGSDNCPDVPNTSQTDTDSDGWGDACDCAPSDPTLPTSTGECSSGCGRVAVPVMPRGLQGAWMIPLLGLAGIALKRKKARK